MPQVERLEHSNYNIPYIDISNYNFIEPDLGLFNYEFANANLVVALERTKTSVTVCMGNPTDSLYKRIKEATGLQVFVVRSCHNKLLSTIFSLYKK